MNVTHETGRHRLTVGEYYRKAEVGLLSPAARVEPIEGEIIDMVPLGSRHAAAGSLLTQKLIRAVGDSAIAWTQPLVRFDIGEYREASTIGEASVGIPGLSAELDLVGLL